MFGDAVCMDAIKVEETCGMHVHIDRRNMTALSLGKLIKFMQDADNKTFLELIAGRKENRFTKLANNLPVSSMIRGTASSDRYQGINVQNTQTAEIRIFKTPDNYNTLLQNLEFVTAITDFTQPSNSGVKELTHGHFQQFVKQNSSTYKQLNSFLKANT